MNKITLNRVLFCFRLVGQNKLDFKVDYVGKEKCNVIR